MSLAASEAEGLEQQLATAGEGLAKLRRCSGSRIRQRPMPLARFPLLISCRKLLSGTYTSIPRRARVGLHRRRGGERRSFHRGGAGDAETQLDCAAPLHPASAAAKHFRPSRLRRPWPGDGEHRVADGGDRLQPRPPALPIENLVTRKP